MDPELREALDRLAADLRGEIRSSNGETRVYVDGTIQASAAETRAYIDDRVQASAAETRAYIDDRVQASAAETRAYIDNGIQASAAETRAYIDERIQTSAAASRRHFDVVGESLRGDMRGLAEGMVLSRESSDRRFAEQTEWSSELEDRLLRLEVRVTSLERHRKSRRRRRP